jgi:hypothetical protein
MENKKKTGSEAKGSHADSDASRHKDHHAPSSDDSGKTPKKRRKVNHGM